MDRRLFLTGTGLGSLVLLAGQFKFPSQPMALEAGDIPAAFDAGTEGEVLSQLFGVTHSVPSDEIKLSAPSTTTAALGAQIEVRSYFTDAEAIAVTVDKSDRPLAAYVRLDRARCFFSTSIHVSETARVSAHVQTPRGIFNASEIVRITGGGFGMHKS